MSYECITFICKKVQDLQKFARDLGCLLQFENNSSVHKDEKNSVREIMELYKDHSILSVKDVIWIDHTKLYLT